MLKDYINKEFAKIPNLDYINPQGKYPIVAFNIKGIHSQDLANYLGNKKIIVRGGLSCAKLAHHIIKEPAVVRASFYLYNDKHDVDVLVKALKSFKKGDIVNHVI
jgi:cysteine desulfurase/selenocysteine lyase